MLRRSRWTPLPPPQPSLMPAAVTIINVDIVRKPKDQVGFAVHPRRWVVERFFG